ncbi:MAG: sigma-70 family RNA polymerase sigma factor [Oscillospiraceae bacterium]|nr:sigma-70 family RNA polymerase sigma factor [Oscillospiraceae bacterium]
MTNKEFEEAHEIAFDAFCKSVIRNACRDAHRKLNTHRKYECQMTDFTEKRLSPRQRDLIYKSFFLEMKDEEIAVSQHRKVQSLKRTKYNVRQKLRRTIGEFEHEKDWGL